MTRRPLPDDKDRAAIATDLTSTLVVEAAAGTGKTTELVTRIVRIIEEGFAAVSEIVAVTFTEKAAGELKLRLRDKLERSRATAEGEPRNRLEQALAHLEEAHVSTLHGFCAELLRERPVEARLDPLFTTLTDGQSQHLFDQAFTGWLQEHLDDPPEGVRRALRRPIPKAFTGSGGSDPEAPIDRLRNAAWKLADWRDFAREWRRPDFDREAEISRMIDRLHEFAALTADPSWSGDSLYHGTHPVRQASEAIARAQDAGRVLRSQARMPHGAIQSQARMAHSAIQSQARMAHGTDYDGWEARLVDLAHEQLERIRTGKTPVYKAGVARADVVAARDAFVHDLRAFCELADADLAALLATELRGALRRYDALKLANGAVDFLDLLIRARDLLCSDAEVRHTFQKRFKRIFVDEFQDTDPVQAEIIFLLAADESVTKTDRPDWLTVPLRPGALFIVADPKQSIYRFRRADVGVYFEVRDCLEKQGAKRVNLTTSFRAQPGIQRLVNAAFEPEMTGDREVLQAEYVPLQQYRAPLPNQPAVVALPVPRPYGKMRGRVAKYAIEASLPHAIAAYIDWLITRSGWRVSDPRDHDKMEALAPQHICVLFRRFLTWGDDVTRPYVDALEARAIPHVLVGGRTFHEREEVENMRAALTAIEWPEDELSVFATLRGPLFAIGDEELLEWRYRFGHLHPFSQVVTALKRSEAGTSDIPDHLLPLAKALLLLRALHVDRNERPIADTIHRLLDATRAHVSFVLRPRGEQVLANVLQVAELARQYELEDGLSFRGFVESLREEVRTAKAAEAPVIEEGADGVRLMTVHKAKGLEFPVVILADITAKLAQRDPDRFINPDANLCVLKLAGWMPVELREHGPLEASRDAAEGVRLAYVAATRARDLLVVPAVGDAPFDDGWLRPLNRAIYPPVAQRRDQRMSSGCPAFKSKDSVSERPDQDPANAETVCPGLHEFGDSAGGHYAVTWWDPNDKDLHLDATPPSGIRRPELITKDADPEVIAAGLAAYESWRSSRESAVEAASQPSIRVHAATAWAARSDLGLKAEQLSDVEVLDVDLPSDRPTGARFGSLVHSILSLVPLDAEAEAITPIAEVHGRILGATDDEITAAPAVVSAILAHPLLDRARAAALAGRLKRELPITLVSDSGELIEGVVDLALEEDDGTTLLDFKTDADLGTRVARYRRQLQAYGAAIQRVTGRPIRLVLLRAAAVAPAHILGTPKRKL